MITGTLIDTALVIIGGLVGLFLHKAFPERVKVIVFQAIGLSIIVVGIQMALHVGNLLLLIFSMLIGGIIGEVIDLQKHFENFGDFLKRKIKSKNNNFTEGIVTAFLIFCIGSMTIIGAIEEGLTGDYSLLLAKSVLDGFTSLALASTYGIGVLFSFIPLLIYQGGITILAIQFKGLFSESVVNELTAVGGVLILGLGINLLGIKKIKVANLLPALIIIIVLAKIF
ncbi:MAG: DUF554 domain-containing protein [Candidatus Pacebacteria bacterium]|nr:DUF554 domain-containing protein [Candidatus Paceibacterota bacterium]